MDNFIRLNSALSWINKDDIICDVGCDHGYLGIMALKKGVQLVQLIDNKINPLNVAVNNIKKEHFLDKVIFSCSNGLDELYDKVNTICILGMGGELISSILNDNIQKISNNTKLILCANTKVELLRRFLQDNSFVITDEQIVKENDKYYELILCYKCDNKVAYSDEELLMGPILIKKRSNLFLEKYTNLYNHYKIILQKTRNDKILKESKLIENIIMNKVKDINDFLLERYPISLASSFDLNKVGLQFGSLDNCVHKVLITLDATNEVIDEAIENECELIISHHPFMFNPMIKMNYDSPFGKKMLKVFNNNLNIFAMHTNFDVAENGMNELLAKALGLKNIKYTTSEIENESFIRYGDIDEMSLESFAKHALTVLGEDGCRIVGDNNKLIKRVGILGGAGSSYLMEAKRFNCDVFVTGEVRMNNAIDAIENDIAIVEVSHSVEEIYREYIREELSKAFPNVSFILSKVKCNPFKLIVK